MIGAIFEIIAFIIVRIPIKTMEKAQLIQKSSKLYFILIRPEIRDSYYN